MIKGKNERGRRNFQLREFYNFSINFPRCSRRTWLNEFQYFNERRDKQSSNRSIDTYSRVKYLLLTHDNKDENDSMNGVKINPQVSWFLFNLKHIKRYK